MQLQLNTLSKEQIKKAWAFAAYKKHLGRRSLRSINQSVITACSKEAKALGVQAGMRYEDARALMPELRILVYGIGERHGKQRA